MISIVYASTERIMKDGICYIGVLKDRVNLGFHQGAHMRDPYGLLEGTGKQMRHIKIRHMSHALIGHSRLSSGSVRQRAGHEIGFDKTRTVTTAVKRKSSAKRIIGTTRL